MNDNINHYIEEHRKRFLYYAPIPKALEFHKLGLSARDRFFMAANRIGKTMACSIEVCMHLTGNYPDWWPGHRFNKPINVWVGGITEKEIDVLQRRYFQGDIGEMPWIHPSLVAYENKTKHQYKIINKFGGTSQIIFKTYQQGRQTWQGEKLDLCHLDEEPPMDIYTEASMRLMPTSLDHHPIMMISATCLQHSLFIHSFTTEVVEVETEVNGEIFMEKKEIQRKEGEVIGGRVFVIAGWKDAAHLDAEEQKQMELKILPHEVEARTKGIPSLGSGMVYPVSDEIITCEPFKIPKHFGQVIGMDFGWKDDTALVFGAYDRDKDIIYIHFEYAMNEKTPEQHVLQLSKMGGANSYTWAPIMHDPSAGMSSIRDGKNLRDVYLKQDLRMIAADNGRESGVQRVYEMMRNGQIQIFNTCTKLLSERRMYARDKDGNVRDGNDHLLDALRYMIVSGIPYAYSEQEMEQDAYFDRFPPHRQPGYM